MICRLCQCQRINVSGPGEYSKWENRMICRARNEECDVPHCNWLNCYYFDSEDDIPHRKYEHTYEVCHGWEPQTVYVGECWRCGGRLPEECNYCPTCGYEYQKWDGDNHMMVEEKL